MKSVGRSVKAYFAWFLGSPTFRGIHRGLYSAIGDRGKTIEFYHCVSDPHSFLGFAAIRNLVERFEISIKVYFVGEPTDEGLIGYATTPNEQKLWRIQDAKHLVELYKDLIGNVEFDGIPNHQAVSSGLNKIFENFSENDGVKEYSNENVEELEKDIEINRQVLANIIVDKENLEAIPNMKEYLHHNSKRLEKKGHYNSGMFRYGFEWFWGIDRMGYIEDMLGKYHKNGMEKKVFNRNYALKMDKKKNTNKTIQLFYSFRSPYSQIILKPIYELAEFYGANIELYPVLPLAMRGQQIPFGKRLYIVTDAKREAERVNMDTYGYINDPLGEPIHNAFKLYLQAIKEGKEKEFLFSWSDHVWCRGQDAHQNNVLESICNQAGFKMDPIYLENDDWKQVAEKNRKKLTSLGNLWGVPTMACGDTCTWGQDRLFVIEQELLD